MSSDQLTSSLSPPVASANQTRLLAVSSHTPIGVQSQERIIGPTGDILLSFVGQPTLEAYEFLGKYLELRKSLLKPPNASAKQEEAKQEPKAN